MSKCALHVMLISGLGTSIAHKGTASNQSHPDHKKHQSQ